MSTVVFYVVVALTASSSLLPARILYDGNAPPLPYRWVVPPRELRQGNQPPEGATGSVPLTAAGSGSGSISTGDAQATVVFPQDAIAESRGEASAQIRIVPQDPASGSPPPPGLRFDGNIYAVAGIYTLSRKPVTLRKPVSVVLRYPLHATTLLRRTDSQWRPLQAETAVHIADLCDHRCLGQVRCRGSDPAAGGICLGAVCRGGPSPCACRSDRPAPGFRHPEPRIGEEKVAGEGGHGTSLSYASRCPSFGLI